MFQNVIEISVFLVWIKFNFFIGMDIVDLGRERKNIKNCKDFVSLLQFIYRYIEDSGK